MQPSRCRSGVYRVGTLFPILIAQTSASTADGISWLIWIPSDEPAIAITFRSCKYLTLPSSANTLVFISQCLAPFGTGYFGPKSIQQYLSDHSIRVCETPSACFCGWDGTGEMRFDRRVLEWYLVLPTKPERIVYLKDSFVALEQSRDDTSAPVTISRSAGTHRGRISGVYSASHLPPGVAMKSHWDLVVVSVLLIGFCGFVILPTIWDRFYILHPTPETESTLLKTYNPEHVIELFKWNQTSGYGRRSGAGAGRKFVTHTVGFDFHFAMRSEKWIPLMNALRDDASAQLLANDAKILPQSGDPHAGFHFDYQIGKSTGTLTILPLTIEHPQRVTPLCPGIVDVNSTIEQTETWFPKLKSRVAPYPSVRARLRVAIAMCSRTGSRSQAAGGRWKTYKMMIALRVVRVNRGWEDYWSKVHQEAA